MKKLSYRLRYSFYKAGYWTVLHDGIEHAGYLAFLGLLSLFPFLVFFVAIAGIVGQSEMGLQFVANISSFLPAHMIHALMPRINEIVSGPPTALMNVAIIAIIWTASSAVEGTRTILNRAYRVETPPAYIWRRLLSIGQFLVLTIAIIIGMSILVLAPVIWHKVKTAFNLNDSIIQSYWIYGKYGLSSLLLFIVVAGSYYVLPNIKQKWISVTPGALIVLVGWVVAADLFARYLQNFEQVNLVYGSLGGIIAALIFFYIVGVIYIFGAEFNYFYERSLGKTFEQKEKVPKKKKREIE